MADLAHPMLIPIARPPSQIGMRPFSEDAQAAVAPLARRTAIYGRPSEQPAVGYVRSHVVQVQEFYTTPPDRAEFDRVVIWLGDTAGRFRASPGATVAEQRNRTFGGYGPPAYIPYRAPNPNDIARVVGGVING